MIVSRKRDEDFDSSYEGLLALQGVIGVVKTQTTPDSVLDSLPTGTYKEWKGVEEDARCLICLDDVCFM